MGIPLSIEVTEWNCRWCLVAGLSPDGNVHLETACYNLPSLLDRMKLFLGFRLPASGIWLGIPSHFYWNGAGCVTW
jgi:hypothetical protein